MTAPFVLPKIKLDIATHIIDDCTYLSGENETVLFTLTNEGYADYTLNLLTSVSKLNMKLLCICLGKPAYDIISKHTKNVCMIEDESDENEFAEISTTSFKKITLIKLMLIKELSHYTKRHVLFTDGDIVFLKNPFDALNTIINNDKTIECIIQNDRDCSSSESYTNLCTGFFWIRHSEKVLEYFTFDESKKNSYAQCEHDQIYFNKYISKHIVYYTLPQSEFPNGSYLQSHQSLENAFIIHFNYIVGNEKRFVMRKYNHWYLESSLINTQIDIINIYMQSPPFWGLGNYIRGCLSLANLCTLFNCNLYLYYDCHPISKYLINYNKYELKNNHTINISIYDSHVTSILKKHIVDGKSSANPLFLSTNALYLKDGVSNKTRDMMRNSMMPTPDLDDLINNVLVSLNVKEKEYTAVHIRMRGKTSDTLYEKLYDAIVTQIQTEYPIVLFSDDIQLKSYMKTKGILVSPNMPCHLADETASDDSIKETLCDYFCLSRAASIYKWCNTGYGSSFANWCADIYKVPAYDLKIQEV